MCKRLSLIWERSASRSHTRRRFVLAAAAVLTLSAIPVAMAGIRLDETLKKAHPTVVEALQRRLTELGFSPGPIDGRWTPQTEAAFVEFCRANKLRPMDRMTRAHIKALWDEDVNPQDVPIEFLRRIGISF